MYDKIAKILEGIDQTQTDNDNGWWETSVGAKFGESKLAEIKKLFEEPNENFIETKPEEEL